MINQEKVEQAIKLLLEGIGEDVSREGLLETPQRIARMYSEICSGAGQNAGEYLRKTFCVDGSQMVIEKDITFYSICEHHLMPFYGKAHIGYLPNGKVIGLSKLARTVDIFAKRLQLQERLSSQIADAIMEYLKPQGVIVVMEAEHLCMTMRGVKKPGSQTITLAAKGAFEVDSALQNTFFRMIGR